jgi:mannose-6-phosphate isomerase-like protein (cupin superfamily)
VAELNENNVLIAKVQGEFVWHTHDEDELFFVVEGKLQIRLHDGDVWLESGDLFVVPSGVEHCPVAAEEVQIMMVEPKVTKHTGNIITRLTQNTYARL